MRGRNDYRWVEIEGADAETFEVLGYELAKDSEHLYFRNQVVDFVDYPSFEVLEHAYHCYIDKNHVYQLRGGEVKTYIDESGDEVAKSFDYLDIVEEADAQSYELLFPLGSESGADYARDKKHVFWHNEVIDDEVDHATFRPLTPFILADKNYIYTEGLRAKVLNEHQSSEGFKLIGKNADIVYTDELLYYVLADNIWQFEVDDADTLGDFDSAWFFTLDHKVYYCGEEIEGADSETFEVIYPFGQMSRDKDHLYYERIIIDKDVTPAEVTFDKDAYNYVYRGKYFNEKTYRFENEKWCYEKYVC